MLIISNSSGSIVSIWSGNVENALSKFFPNRNDFSEHYFNDDSDVLNNSHKYKIVDGNYIIKEDEKIKQIKDEYQNILDNLIQTKLRMDILGQPTVTITTAYKNKKDEMDTTIRSVV